MTRRRILAGLAAGAALTLTTGCGGGSSSGDPSAADPTSGSPSATPSASSSPGGPYASYNPATGSRIALGTFTAHAPSGWRLDHTFGSHVVFADKGAGEIEFSELTYPPTGLAAMAKIARDGGSWTRKPAIRKPVTIDGTRFYRLAGPIGGGHYVEEFGAVRQMRRIKLSFELPGSAAAATKLVGSVLATVHLR